MIEEPGNSRAFRGQISLTVEEAFAVTRTEKAPHRVEIRWAMGSKVPADIIRTTIVAPVIVADRVVDILKAGSFSGWESYAVELVGKDGAVIPGYQGLAVHGRCGPIENDRSVKFDKIMPGGAFPWWRGLYFDPATWDGSHIFMPAGRVGWIFVVDDVKQALEKAKVKNVTFRSLDEIERSKVEMSVSLNP